MPGGARLTIGEPATTPGQRGVVRHGQPKAEQAQHAPGERLGLAKRKMEDEPQGQHQLDRQVRVERLPAGRCPPRGPPSRQRRLVEPEGHIPAPLETGLVGRPIRDPITRLRNAMTARGVVLERHPTGVAGPSPAGYPAASLHHLWTPPSGQGETSGMVWRVVGCCHLSGLCCGSEPPRACMGVRGPGPYQRRVLKARWCSLVVPIPSRRLLRHVFLPLAPPPRGLG